MGHEEREEGKDRIQKNTINLPAGEVDGQEPPETTGSGLGLLVEGGWGW